MSLANYFLRRPDGRAGAVSPVPLGTTPKNPAAPALGGLAAVVGTAVAAALFTATPAEESGRKVSVTMDAAGKPTVRHISGKQYLRVYLDIVGVATACDGITGPEIDRARRNGRVFTEAECTVMLETALLRHAKHVMNCSPGLALSSNPAIEARRQGPRFAAVSGDYNHGRYCTSTARARFNGGDYPGGCTALTWFNKAGGKVNRGLVGRRERERNVCVNGLTALHL